MTPRVIDMRGFAASVAVVARLATITTQLVKGKDHLLNPLRQAWNFLEATELYLLTTPEEYNWELAEKLSLGYLENENFLTLSTDALNGANLTEASHNIALTHLVLSRVAVEIFDQFEARPEIELDADLIATLKETHLIMLHEVSEHIEGKDWSTIWEKALTFLSEPSTKTLIESALKLKTTQ